MDGIAAGWGLEAVDLVAHEFDVALDDAVVGALEQLPVALEACETNLPSGERGPVDVSAMALLLSDRSCLEFMTEDGERRRGGAGGMVFVVCF